MSDCCSGANVLIYACSGASNVGQLTNESAKELTGAGYGNMTCGIGLGAGISGFIVSAKDANKNIVLDGCPVACLKKVFHDHGLVRYDHYVLTEMGFEKNKDLSPDPLDIKKILEQVTQGSGLVLEKKSEEPGSCCSGGCL